jgi:hypothetical protein
MFNILTWKLMVGSLAWHGEALVEILQMKPQKFLWWTPHEPTLECRYTKPLAPLWVHHNVSTI